MEKGNLLLLPLPKSGTSRVIGLWGGQALQPPPADPSLRHEALDTARPSFDRSEAAHIPHSTLHNNGS